MAKKVNDVQNGDLKVYLEKQDKNTIFNHREILVVDMLTV